MSKFNTNDNNSIDIPMNKTHPNNYSKKLHVGNERVVVPYLSVGLSVAVENKTYEHITKVCDGDSC